MAKQSDTSKPNLPQSPKPAKGSSAADGAKGSRKKSTANPSAGAEKALRANPAKDTRPPASSKASHKV